MQHVRAQVLGKVSPHAPALPVPTQGRVVRPQPFIWHQAHDDHSEVALDLGLPGICRHLAGNLVGGEAVADGILPALTVIPEEGKCGLDLMDKLGHLQPVGGCGLDHSGNHGH